MANQQQKERPGRTSSEGRKLSSGGDEAKRGNPKMNENNKSEQRDMKKPQKRRS